MNNHENTISKETDKNNPKVPENNRNLVDHSWLRRLDGSNASAEPTNTEQFFRYLEKIASGSQSSERVLQFPDQSSHEAFNNPDLVQFQEYSQDIVTYPIQFNFSNVDTTQALGKLSEVIQQHAGAFVNGPFSSSDNSNMISKWMELDEGQRQYLRFYTSEQVNNYQEAIVQEKQRLGIPVLELSINTLEQTHQEILQGRYDLENQPVDLQLRLQAAEKYKSDYIQACFDLYKAFDNYADIAHASKSHMAELKKMFKENKGL